MPSAAAVDFAVGLSLVACVVALTALLRQRQASRSTDTMQLSLALLRSDAGLAQLDAATRRSDTWWTDAPDGERREIDRALTRWDLAAWQVARGRVDSGVVVGVLGWEVVELWERAYPYVLHRRVEHPAIWSSLTDLYLDAYATTRAGKRAVAAAPEPAPAAPRQHSVSPDVLPPPPEFIEVGPADHLRPVPEPVEPVRPRPTVDPRIERLAALLREGQMDTTAAPLMPPVHRRPAPDVAVEVESRQPAPRAPRPSTQGFVEVIDLVDFAVGGARVDPMS